jgi:glycosyltransferase involved in cell wall biosynthesis
MMHVTHVSNDFEPLSGGIATHLRNLLPAQAKNGIKPTLLVPYSTIESERQISVDDRYEPFYVVRAPYLKARTPINKMIRLTQATREGLEWIEKEFGRPDLIHQHDNRATRIGTTLHAHKREVPLIWTNHSSRFFGKENLSGRMLTAIPGIRPDGLVVVHRMMQKPFEESWECPVSYIPNGVDTEFFTPSGKSEKSFTTVLFPQRMIPGKGAELLAEAAAILLTGKEATSFQFRFAGSGEESNRDAETIQRVKKRLSAWAEGDAVQFLGNLTYDEMPAEYQRADVVVLPFKTGTESLSLYEAWAAGTPVITFRLEISNDLPVHGENCILMDETDPKDLVTAIRKLVKDRRSAKRITENALKTVRSKCSWNQRAIQMKEFYKEIIEVDSV